jgi:prophage regulatory protein
MVDNSLEMWRLPTVIQKTGLKHVTIYKMMKAGTFPLNFTLSPNAVGWRSDEVLNWMVSREPAPVMEWRRERSKNGVAKRAENRIAP